jgi:hypothetical protein
LAVSSARNLVALRRLAGLPGDTEFIRGPAIRTNGGEKRIA